MRWFRFYHDAIDDPKVQRLPAEIFKFWVNMLCLASRSQERGVITQDVTEIAFAMRLPDECAERMVGELCRRGLLEECTEGYAIHNWDSRQFKSDDVSSRVAKHRSNAQSDEMEQPEAASETLQETLHATSDETLKSSVYTDSDSETDTEAEESGGADAPATPKPRRRKHQVPEDFAVTDEMRQWFAAKVPHLPAAVIEPETEKFRDHYGSTGEARLDWVKSWQNWMRRVRRSDYEHLLGNVTQFQQGRRGSGRNGGYTASELLAMGRGDNS